jgi:hypothetical protein
MQIEAHSLHSSSQINLTNFMHEVNRIKAYAFLLQKCYFPCCSKSFAHFCQTMLIAKKLLLVKHIWHYCPTYLDGRICKCEQFSAALLCGFRVLCDLRTRGVFLNSMCLVLGSVAGGGGTFTHTEEYYNI